MSDHVNACEHALPQSGAILVAPPLYVCIFCRMRHLEEALRDCLTLLRVSPHAQDESFWEEVRRLENVAYG